ncbi:FAD-dependent oxidoreductase [Labedaea rhizosphaerae]|uniref:2-polyprenyl-6-methoxyphenol hydroxylase-like FAD-dependent oxidoreductase n=1 Tax=Labedaea rhizosphaerae TaxID=598644 RepID=A0A4R6S0I9_LABRH|nr:NAD(P)/FAD-dependent oxidoreductase [Labedaea rhizosphaerae]TDP92991.1 2-polyprenyl-6-methoxyphenol hydroxylase-like FAD-dependent oxidoreductase [Labedaea rhizosphaerae]
MTAALPASVDVVVSGAGVGGLAAARALGASGLRVLLVDRRRTPVPTAKGEILQPESLRVLDQWGVLDALRDTDARPVDRLAIRDRAGKSLLRIDYAGLPGPHRQVLCAEYRDLCAVLADGMPDTVRILRGVRVTDVLRDDSGRIAGVRAVGDGAGPGGTEVHARLVVAADGMSSPLRKAAGIAADRDEYPHRLLAFDVTDVEVDAELSAYRTDRGLCLVYPLPRRRCRVYVQVRPDEFRAGGTSALDAWCDTLLADVPALVPVAGPLRASLHRRQLFAVSRLRAHQLAAPGLALVGESAHAVHPMAAQGVNSSLVDAEVLATALADQPSEDEALAAYEAARRPRLDHIATVSHNATRMITALSGAPKLLGARMMRRTAANPRLLRKTAGNLSGTDVQPLTFVDRLYQLGLLVDRHADRVPAGAQGVNR